MQHEDIDPIGPVGIEPYITARIVAAAVAGLGQLDPKARFLRLSALIEAARTSVTAELIRHRGRALLEWRESFRGAHGAAAVIARDLDASPQYVNKLLRAAEVAADEEAFWENPAAELEAKPHRRLRVVDSTVEMVISALLYGALDDAHRDQWDDAAVLLRGAIESLGLALRAIEGEASSEARAEAARNRSAEQPGRTSPGLEQQICDLRRRTGWGCRRIKNHLAAEGVSIAESTVWEVLRRHGLNKRNPSSERP